LKVNAAANKVGKNKQQPTELLLAATRKTGSKVGSFTSLAAANGVGCLEPVRRRSHLKYGPVEVNGANGANFVGCCWLLLTITQMNLV
jgi:hypothetical protein